MIHEILSEAIIGWTLLTGWIWILCGAGAAADCIIRRMDKQKKVKERA